MVVSIWVFQLERDHIGGIILPRQESGKQDCGAELEDDFDLRQEDVDSGGTRIGNG